MYKRSLFAILLICMLPSLHAQNKDKQGSLFIIGGGRRSPQLMKDMLETAGLQQSDYIIVLPMASAEPDTAYYYFKKSLEGLCINPVINFSFTEANLQNKEMNDLLSKAKLIFIAGGDQTRFMKLVLHSPVFNSIHKAFDNGATIAGTSAGAAVMNKYMITGNERTDTVYHETIKKIVRDNIEITEGLGLVQDAIIDQHFIVRSRYNRLLSALAQFPQLECIGIDEATALICKGHKKYVRGEGQVIVFRHPQKLKYTDKGLIQFSSATMSIYTKGDEIPEN